MNYVPGSPLRRGDGPQRNSSWQGQCADTKSKEPNPHEPRAEELSLAHSPSSTDYQLTEPEITQEANF